MDYLTKSGRSRQMALVKSKNTGLELKVRRLVHSLGYRYRLHIPTLPGKPDLVFSKKKKVIFVHGCFWHRHHGCKKSTMPVTNVAYWEEKFARNVARDKKVNTELINLGWDILTIWECDIVNIDTLKNKISEFLNH